MHESWCILVVGVSCCRGFWEAVVFDHCFVSYVLLIISPFIIPLPILIGIPGRQYASQVLQGAVFPCLFCCTRLGSGKGKAFTNRRYFLIRQRQDGHSGPLPLIAASDWYRVDFVLSSKWQHVALQAFVQIIS